MAQGYSIILNIKIQKKYVTVIRIRKKLFQLE